MSKIKDFVQAPENRSQIKAFVIGFAVLVATFSATLLTGWITSLKSTPKEVRPPFIFFEQENDLLLAKANRKIETWQYIGPNLQSICGGTLFDDFLGFGQTFKEGDQVRLEYERDLNKHYCFKAVDQDGLTEFGNHYVVDLERPAITFKLTTRRLTASLDARADKQDFDISSWQHAPLKQVASACGREAFSIPELVVNSPLAELPDGELELHYCFRIRKRDDSYAYRAKSIFGWQNEAIGIQLLQSGGNLYLLADQKIRNWVVGVADETPCDAKQFTDGEYYVSEKQLAVIHLHLASQQPEDYCIRAQNETGLYSYIAYENQQTINILVEPHLNPQENTLTLTARAEDTVTLWTIVSVTGVGSCKESAFNAGAETIQNNAIDLSYPVDQAKIYCWRAVRGEDNAYAVYIVPRTNNLIATYRDRTTIRAQAMLSPLTSWRYITAAPANTAAEHCTAADFSRSGVSDGEQATLSEAAEYCFQATDAAEQQHYGSWLKAGPRPVALAVEEAVVNIANDLELTRLGRFILYAADPKIHASQAEFALACPANAEISCYSEDDGRLHLLRHSTLSEKQLVKLRSSFIQTVYLDYLTDTQRRGLNFELLILYRQHQEFFDQLLPTNFYRHHFYEDEFVADFHAFLLAKPYDWPDGLSAWSSYYHLFFE